MISEKKKKKVLFNKLLSKGIYYNCSAPEVSGIASLAVKGYNDANTKSSLETEVLLQLHTFKGEESVYPLKELSCKIVVVSPMCTYIQNTEELPKICCQNRTKELRFCR